MNYRKIGYNDFDPAIPAKESFDLFAPMPCFGRGLQLEEYKEGWEKAKSEYEKEQERKEACPFEQLRERVNTCSFDPDLIDILNDFIDLIERSK